MFLSTTEQNLEYFLVFEKMFWDWDQCFQECKLHCIANMLISIFSFKIANNNNTCMFWGLFVFQTLCQEFARR